MDEEDGSLVPATVEDEKQTATCEGYKKKILEIRKVIDNINNYTDKSLISKLQNFALTDGGFVDDELRKFAWPALLGIKEGCCDQSPSQHEMRSHSEYSQVVLDVKRSVKRFPPSIPYEKRVALQDRLIVLIMRVIMKHTHLKYYQGYHDVAITFLLVVDEDVAFQILEKLSNDHLRLFMAESMTPTAQKLDFIYPLFERIQPKIYEHLERAEVGTMFCLPWFLTWYSHTLTRYEHVVRFYDYFIASPSLLPLYLIPVIVTHRREEVLGADCDLASLHYVLSKLPEDLPYDSLLRNATKLMKKYPPDKIEKEVLIREKRRSGLLPAKRHWNLNKLFPEWFLSPSKFRFLIVGASFAVGLYAYLRYSDIYQ